MAFNYKKTQQLVNNEKQQQNEETKVPDFSTYSSILFDINRQYEELREEQRRKNAAILEKEDEETIENDNDDVIEDPVVKEEPKVPQQHNKEHKNLIIPTITIQTDKTMPVLVREIKKLSCNTETNSQPLPLPNGKRETNSVSPRPSEMHEVKTPQVRTKTMKQRNIANLSHDNFVTPQRPVPTAVSHSQPAPQGQARIQCTIDMRSHLNTLGKSQSVTKVKHSKAQANLANVYKKPAIHTIAEDTSENGDAAKKPLKEYKIKEVFKSIIVNQVEYLVLNVLGKGGSSTVYHCYNPQTKEECAVKCVDLNQDRNEVMGFINEVHTLKRLQGCDRIIKLHQFQILQDEHKLLVVLEKGGRDFSQILREHAKKQSNLPPFMIIYYWMQMLYAVQQIHSHGVIHSDLKPANFLETQEHLKLIDFGISSCVQLDMTSVVKTVALGTFGYISPEALCQDRSNVASPNVDKPKYKISFRSDVWSLGCILYQLIYKRTPFDHVKHSAAKLATIMDPNHQIVYPRADWVPPRILDCVKTCLQYDARSRPSIDDLIQEYQDFVNKF